MQEMEIVILRLVKTKPVEGKSRKTIMTYGIKSVDSSENTKGFMICEQWFDTPDVFDKVGDSNLCVPLKAKYSYKILFNGQARMNIEEIYDQAGNCIMV